MKSLFLAAILALAAGCGEKQPEAVTVPLDVSPTKLSFVGLGEQKALSVTSSTDWLARSSASWLKVKTASGKGGESASQLLVEAEENKTAEERSTVLTVKNLRNESVEIAVAQAAGGDAPSQRGISTAEDLVAFAKAVNGEGSIASFIVDGMVKFNNDIDASSIKEWIPAGSESNPLTYSINGNNKTIKNVNWKVDVSKYSAAGFIGCAKGVTISKLTLGSEGSKIELSGAPSGGKLRAGGFIGRAEGVTLEKLVNNASLTVSGTSATGNNLILGGIAGYADQNTFTGGDNRSSKGCVNNGNVTAPVVSHTGGIVGYNSGTIQNCTNYGKISSPADGSHGPGWLCSYNATKSKVTENYGYGFVGDTPAMLRNAMMNCEAAFDPEANSVDWTLDAYYEWTQKEHKTLCSGAEYYHYSCTNVPREIFVVEVDLKNPAVEITTAMAGEMVPNPNGNDNNNNGFKLRERLSDVCARRRAEGQKILAGVNSGFFDSNDGIPRGFHIEEGEPVYINNPAVASALSNHVWAITVFSDGTASCGKKTFSGKMRAGGKEYSYNSVNDTILRHTSASYKANLFTSRYKEKPYNGFTNPLAKDAYYVICEYTGSPMTVNTGYAAAKVVDIRDGRTTPLTSLPYITAKNRIGIALSGDMASLWSAFIKVGDTVELRCDIAVDGDASKPILTQNSSMYLLMTDGQDTSGSPGSSASLYTKYDPKTFPVVSADLSRVWLVEVDGRQQWYSIGVKGYEIYRIAKKLGGAWTTGLDGGGSAAFWLWNSSSRSGKIVSKPSDGKGERSCMNYLLVREK